MTHGALNSPATSAESTRVHIVHATMRLLRIVRYRRHTLVLVLGIAVLLGAVYFVAAPRMYLAQATLLVLNQGTEPWSGGPASDGFTQGLMPTYEGLFRSRVVLQAALEKLQGPLPVYLAGKPENEQLQEINQHLSAHTLRATRFIQVGYQAENRAHAQHMVEALVDAYLDFIEENHRSVAVEIVGILDRERREVGQRLADKEAQLLDAKARMRDLGLRSGSEVLHPLVQKVVQISEMLVQSQHKRVKLEASRSAIATAMAQEADLRQYLIDLEPVVGQELVAQALGLDSNQQQVVLEVEQRLTADRVRLQKLAEYLGPRNPEYVELKESIDQSQAYLDDLRQRAARRSSQLSSQQLGPLLTSMIDEQLRQARIQETRLQEEYQKAESEAVQLNGRVAYVSILEHDLKLLRDLHDTLRNRIANIDIQQNQSDVRVAIVSPPSAGRKPVTPRALAVALFCLVLGSGGGLVAVSVQEALDDRFRSPEELRQQLGVPLLAIVRSLTLAATEGAESLQVHVDPEAVESEAFRTLRTALAFSDNPVHTVAVSSAEPEDGKTTVLSNLGTALAQSGKRTLLIDGDLRRPGLTRRFQLRGQSGLGDILRDTEPVEAALSATIRSSGLARMDVLPCGRRPPDPAGQLASQRFGELLAWCNDHYDVVLIDTPPILAASDAAVVGRQTDGMVVVVQPEKNHRRLVHRAIDELRLAGLPVLGVVANRIAASGGHYDQGGYGYGYGYGYRYTSDDSYDDVQLDTSPAYPQTPLEGQVPEHSPAAPPVSTIVPATGTAPILGPLPAGDSQASEAEADPGPIRPRRAA